MPAKRYRVRLTAEERKELETEVNTGTGSGRRLRRARILLMADEAQVGGGFNDAEIAKANALRRGIEFNAEQKAVSYYYEERYDRDSYGLFVYYDSECNPTVGEWELLSD